MPTTQVLLIYTLLVGYAWGQAGGGQLRTDDVFEAYPPGQYLQPGQGQIVATKNGQLVRAYPASALKRLRLVPVQDDERRSEALYSLAPSQGDQGQRSRFYPEGQGDLQAKYKTPVPVVRPQLKAVLPHRLKPLHTPASYAKEEEAEEEYASDPNPQYNFSFDVKDDELTNYQNRQEERDGGVIKGSYSVVDPDGYVRTVTYTADSKNGFQAKVVREPTDVKIKFPVATPAPEEEDARALKAKAPLRVQYPQAYATEDQSQVYRQPQQYNQHLPRRPLQHQQPLYRLVPNQ